MSTQAAKAAAIIVALYLLDEETPKRKRKNPKKHVLVRELKVKRENLDFYGEFCKDFHTHNPELYKNFIRILPEDFDYLLKRVEPIIQKQDTKMKKAISAGERLVITLRYLATGESFKSLMYSSGVHTSTISKILPEVCSAIYEVLKDEFLKAPSTELDWKRISRNFYEKCDFPNCIGALDGRHIVLRAPSNSGNEYYNYKGSFSIVLMALADADYKFSYIDVGQSCHNSKNGIFNHCTLLNALRDNSLNIPANQMLPKTKKSMPFVMVADDAFTLKPNLMKPYSFTNLERGERIFNYRLSRAKGIIENVFGIIPVRFKVLCRPIELNPSKATTMILAICALHNFIMTRQSRLLYAAINDFDRENKNGEVIPGSWRNERTDNIFQLRPDNGNSSSDAKQIRDEFKNYFTTYEGEIPWQYKFI